METAESILIFLNNITNRMAQDISEEEILAYAAQYICKNPEITGIAVYLPDSGNKFILKTTCGKPLDYNYGANFLHDFPELKSGIPITITPESDNDSPGFQIPIKEFGHGFINLIPVIFSKNIDGIIVIASEDINSLNKQCLSHLRSIAAITAICIREKATLNRIGYINQAGKKLASYQEINEIMNTITDGVCEALGIKGCSIQLFDRSRERLINCVCRGLSSDFIDKGPVSDKKVIANILKGNNIFSYDAAREAEPQHRTAFVNEGIVSTFSVPLVSDNDIIGVLKAYTSAPHTFTAGETAVLETFASYGALIIKNAQRLNRVHSINILSKLITKQNDPDELLDIAAGHITEVMNVKGCFIMLFDRDQKSLYVGAYHGLSDEFAEYVKLDKENIVNLIRSGATFQVEDVCNDDRVQYRDLSILEGISSYLSVPLYCEGNITGTIRALASYRHRFSREEEEYLNALSSFISLTTENVLIQNRNQFIKEIVEEISSTNDPRECIPEILQGLTDLTNIKACTFSTFDGSNKALLKHELIYNDGYTNSSPKTVIEDFMTIPRHIKDKIEQEVQIVRIKGSSLELHRNINSLKDLNQAVFFPVFNKGILAGVITLYTAGNRELTAGELKFASTIAGLVGICS